MDEANYSTTCVSQKLLTEISDSLLGLDYGSIEIYVVNSEVTQITKRQIKKTNQKNTALQRLKN